MEWNYADVLQLDQVPRGKIVRTTFTSQSVHQEIKTNNLTFM